MRLDVALLFATLMAVPAHADQINFGDDSSEFADDGECDDRRFRGNGMADALDWNEMGRDASDCRALFDAREISVWVFSDALAATQCSAIEFGSNGSEYADDGACDDNRFEGMGAAEVMLSEDRLKDANDCRRLCDFGLLGLRNY